MANETTSNNVVIFPAHSNQTQTKTVVIPNLTDILSVTVNTGDVTFTRPAPDEIAITVSNGTYVSRDRNTGYEYKEVTNQPNAYYSDGQGYSGTLSPYTHIPVDYRSEYDTVTRYGTRNLRCNGSSWSVTSETSFSYPASLSYSSGGYSGTLYSQGSSTSSPIDGGDSCDVNGRTTSQTLTGTAYYAGTVTRPAVYRYEGTVSRSYTYYDNYKYAYEVIITYTDAERTGVLKLTVSDKNLSLPIYNPLIGMDGKNQLRFSLGSNVQSFELVDGDSPKASPLRVMTTLGVKAVAKE